MYRFLILMLVLTSVAFADKGPVNASVTLDALGTRVSALDQYSVNVKNQVGAAMSAGQFVILDVANDDGYSVISAPVTAGAKPHCMLKKTCAIAAICECQTYGYTSVALFENAGGTATAGEHAYLSGTFAGFSAAIVAFGGAAAVVVTDNPVGVFLDSPSADGTTELFLRLR